jgi:hypothetical protein
MSRTLTATGAIPGQDVIPKDVIPGLTRDPARSADGACTRAAWIAGQARNDMVFRAGP